MTYSIAKKVVFDSSNMSAFGTLETSELTPSVQLDFVYGINTINMDTTTANGGTVNTNASRLRLQCGTNSAGSAIWNSKKIIKYRTGQGIVVRFTAAFSGNATSNTQIIGAGNSVDGVFVGYNGTSFGLLHRNNSVDTWIPQSSWNGDKANGTGGSAFNIDTTKLNVFQIKYPYLAAGNIMFYVQDSETGSWILIHEIKYANSSASTEFTNPNFYLYAASINTGNTTNLTMYSGSMAGFLSGVRGYTGATFAADNSKSGITTETCILNIKNCSTYNGVTNRGVIRLNTVSFAVGAVGSNGISTLRFKKGATIGGTPVYTPVNGSTADNGNTITSGNAIASVDTAGTTVTGGINIWSLNANLQGSSFIDLTPYEFVIYPGEVLTISGTSTSSAQLGATISWTADL